MTTNFSSKFIAILVLLGLGGCVQSSVASEKSDATKVEKIVFVGRKHACPCTKRTIDASWSALQKALGKPAKLPVERLQIDTESEKVAPYRKQKPMMALPAIYFVDGKNAVLELLQGEVTEKQIVAALGAKKSAP